MLGLGLRIRHWEKRILPCCGYFVAHRGALSNKCSIGGLERCMAWGFVTAPSWYQYILLLLMNYVAFITESLLPRPPPLHLQVNRWQMITWAKPGLLLWEALCKLGSDIRSFPKSELKYDEMSKVLDSVQAWDVRPLSQAYQISSASLPSLMTTQPLGGSLF